MSRTRGRFAEAVRQDPVDLALACLLVGGEVDPDIDIESGLAALDELAAAARPLVPPGCSPASAAAGLQSALGRRAGFSGSAADYDDVSSSLLPAVLRRRRGLPLLLSVVWLEVAARLGVPARPAALPGHVVVVIGEPRPGSPGSLLGGGGGGGRGSPGGRFASAASGLTPGAVVVDPFAGGVVVSPDRLRSGLAALSDGELLLRLLTNIRALAARQPPGLGPATTRLWSVELSLLLPRHPVELRRERGELLVRLGRHREGAEELKTYALVVEDADEAEAERARREARMAVAQLN